MSQEIIQKLVSYFERKEISVAHIRSMNSSQWMKHLPDVKLRDKVKACFGISPYKFSDEQKKEMKFRTAYLQELGVTSGTIMKICLYFQDQELPVSKIV